MINLLVAGKLVNTKSKFSKFFIFPNQNNAGQECSAQEMLSQIIAIFDSCKKSLSSGKSGEAKQHMDGSLISP